MNEFGKVIFICGVVMAAIGFAIWKLAGKTPLGHLPGDISVQKPGFVFYFPVMTCVVVSVVLSLLLWLFRR